MDGSVEANLSCETNTTWFFAAMTTEKGFNPEMLDFK